MLHNRQFILAQQPHLFSSHWQVEQLDNGYYLSFHQNLKVHFNKDKSICLIGDAWQIKDTRKDPLQIIEEWGATTPLDTIYQEEESWCGRYIILTSLYVLTDATSNLGCFYSRDTVSCSLSLLMQCVDNMVVSLPSSLSTTEGLDYLPGMLTMSKKIKRLLPSQKLEYQKGQVSVRPLLYTTPANSQAALEEFKHYFLQGVEAFYNHYSDYNVWLPISGGKDSRVCFAAFEKLHKDFRVYVWQNREAKYAGCYQDLGVSRLLCEKTHKKLVVVFKDKNCIQRQKVEEFRLHTADMTTMSAKWQYPCDTLRMLQASGEKNVQVRNNIWELACNDYDYHDIMNSPEKINEAWKDKADVCEQSINDWLDWVNKDVVNTNVSLGDRAYWDLRLGCWLADGMQGFDIFDNIETINILNCRYFLSLLMAQDKNIRGTRFFEVELANGWYPSFRDVPYEEDYHDIYLTCVKWKGKLVRKIKKLVMRK